VKDRIPDGRLRGGAEEWGNAMGCRFKGMGEIPLISLQQQLLTDGRDESRAECESLAIRFGRS